MLRVMLLEITCIFMAMDFILWLGFTEEIKYKERNRKSGRSRIYLKIMHYMMILIYLFYFFCGFYAMVLTPRMINCDFETVEGTIKEVHLKSVEEDNESESIYRYEHVVIEDENTEYFIGTLISPEVKKGDHVEVYWDPYSVNFITKIKGEKITNMDPFFECVVSEINGIDVTNWYEEGMLVNGLHLPIVKTVIGIYIVVAAIAQICLYNSNKKKYLKIRQNTSRFIYGKDIETLGYKLWKIGEILQTIMLVVVLIGIGDMFWDSMFLIAFSWIRYLGYWLVCEGSYRCAVYTGYGFYVKESCGYIWNYSLENITGITKIGAMSYNIFCKDGRTYKISIHNDNQKKVLKHMIGENPIDYFEETFFEQSTKDEIVMMKKMSKGQKEQLIARRNNSYKRKVCRVRIIFYVFIAIVIFAINVVAIDQRAWIGISLWIMMGISITVSTRIRLKRAERLNQNLLEKDILYAYVKEMAFDTTLKFSDEEGNIYEREFSSKEFERFLKEEAVYILHVPENESWTIEKEL